jgi:AraC family ethanolamine operon transcriptional activator
MNNNNVLMPAASVVLPPTFPLQRFLTSDIDEHARNMDGWQVRYDQLSPGPFTGELVAFRSDWMQLVRDRSNQAMIKRGAAWKGAITFSIPLSANGPVYCSGHPIHEPSLLVAHGENLPELHTPQHLDLLGVAIDERALEHVLERQGSQFRITDLPKCYRLGHSSVLHDLAALFDELAGCDQGRDAVLGHDSIRRGIRDAVMLHVLELIAPDQAPPLNPTARKRMVDRAREYEHPSPWRTGSGGALGFLAFEPVLQRLPHPVWRKPLTDPASHATLLKTDNRLTSRVTRMAHTT